MKRILFSALLFVSVCSLNSCAKCLKCKNAVESIKFCTKDSQDQAALNLEKAYYEADGYKCVSSSEGL